MWQEKASYQPEDIVSILQYLEEDVGGFNDLFLIAGRPPIYKKDSKNQLLGKRNLQVHEVKGFVNFITEDTQAASQLMSSSEELKPSFTIGKRNAKQYRYRVSVVPARDSLSSSSPQIVMRSIQGDPMPLEVQNVEPELEQALKTVNVGSVVVAGPTGSGKSSLMSGVIAHRVSDENSHENILTYEAPIEYVYDRVCEGANIVVQHEIAPVGGHLKTFAAGIRSALRQAPTTILVGESRDEETFDNFMKAANTGHLALTTMHVNTVADIPNRVISEFPGAVRKARLLEFCASSKIWCVQLLIPKVGGGRVPIREFLILKPEHIEKLSATEPENVRDVVFDMVRKDGQTLEQCAAKYFESGDISEKHYKLISAGAL